MCEIRVLIYSYIVWRNSRMTLNYIVTAGKSRTEAERPIRQRSRGFQHQAHVPTVNLALHQRISSKKWPKHTHTINEPFSYHGSISRTRPSNGHQGIPLPQLPRTVACFDISRTAHPAAIIPRPSQCSKTAVRAPHVELKGD